MSSDTRQDPTALPGRARKADELGGGRTGRTNLSPMLGTHRGSQECTGEDCRHSSRRFSFFHQPRCQPQSKASWLCLGRSDHTRSQRGLKHMKTLEIPAFPAALGTAFQPRRPRMHKLNIRNMDFPGGAAVKTPVLPMQGARV